MVCFHSALDRASRDITVLTWSKEMEVLRHFFRFCVDRDWTNKNPAKLARTPKNVKPKPVEPYTPEEITRIIFACEQIGRSTYDRARAKAMILLLRYTGLRISEVATLARDRVQHGRIYLRTMKNGKAVSLPVPPDLQATLDALPAPRAACGESTHFFWSGNGSKEVTIRGASRTLKAVFPTSGVPRAHAHRFRHTLATEILAQRGTFEDVGDILGNSPAIIRKHYAQWNIRGRSGPTACCLAWFLAHFWHTRKRRL